MTGKPHQGFTCPCCGYGGLSLPAYQNLKTLPVAEDLKPPYSLHFGEPSYEVCNRCGYEFGNDDEPGTGAPVSFQQYLREWLEGGGVWFDAQK